MDAIPQMPFTTGDDPFLNPDRKCPVVLVLDRSFSMLGPKIDALNKGIQAFAQDVSGDLLALKRTELAIVSFGPVQVVQTFATIDRCQIPHLTAENDTPMGEAVLKAIDLVEDRKRFYKASVVPYYRPIIFMLTDGAATDDISAASRAVRDGEGQKRFMFFAVGVEGADMKALGGLSVRPPVALRGLAFGPMFQWLSASTKAVANSQPGQTVGLPPVHGWGQVSV